MAAVVPISVEVTVCPLTVDAVEDSACEEVDKLVVDETVAVTVAVDTTVVVVEVTTLVPVEG